MPHTTPPLHRRRTVLPALLLLLILLPACGQDATRPAQPDGPPRAAFHGLGQEPGWLLDIHPSGELRFAWDYGQRELIVPSPPPSTTSTIGSGRVSSIIDDATLDAAIGRLGIPNPDRERPRLSAGVGRSLPRGSPA